MTAHKRVYLSVLLFLAPFFSQSQEFGTDSLFSVFICKASGDLNKDGTEDLVIVTQDTVDVYAPYRLEVFFTQKDRTQSLVVSTTKAIMPQFPNGRDGMLDGGFDTITIKKGVLWIEEVFTRGHMEHKFRYQNNRFELIGFTYVAGGSCCIQIIDYNLSTGRRIEKYGTIDMEKIPVTSDTIRKLEPLPNLTEFEVLTGEYF